MRGTHLGCWRYAQSHPMPPLPPCTSPVVLPYSASPLPSAVAVMPGDSRLGGWLCWRCGEHGTTPFLIFDELPCDTCGGVRRVFNQSVVVLSHPCSGLFAKLGQLGLCLVTLLWSWWLRLQWLTGLLFWCACGVMDVVGSGVVAILAIGGVLRICWPSTWLKEYGWLALVSWQGTSY
jgi:hypothetical protein